MFKMIGELVGEVVGTVAGIAIAPLSIALNVSEAAIKRAIDADCRTEKEIREFLDLD